MSRNAPPKEGALRDIPKNGFEGDFIEMGLLEIGKAALNFTLAFYVIVHFKFDNM